MTKIGPGDEGMQPQNIHSYRNELIRNTNKFQNAMDAYVSTQDTDEKSRLQALMNEELGLIRAAVKEIRTKGLYKVDMKLESDYQKFIQDPHGENVAALAQDIETLREQVGGSEPPVFGIRG